MNNHLFFSIILQLVGVGVIIAEIILPTGGILSIAALAVFGYSLFIVFKEISVTMGFFFVAADLILIPVLVIVGLKLLARSPVTLRKTLSRKEGVSPSLPSWKVTSVPRGMLSRISGLRVLYLSTAKESMRSPVVNISKKRRALLLLQ